MWQRLHDGGGNIGRIGNQHVKRSPLGLAVERRHEIAQTHIDVRRRNAQRIAVADAQIDCTGLNVDCDALSTPRALRRNGKRDATRTAPNLENARASNLTRPPILSRSTLGELALFDRRGTRYARIPFGAIGRLNGPLAVLRRVKIIVTQFALDDGRLILFLCRGDLGLQGGLDFGVPGQLNTPALGCGSGPDDLSVEIGQDLFNQQLGLGPWDEHAGLAHHIDRAEARLTDDVLQRLALRAAHNGRVHCGKLLARHRFVKVHVYLSAREPSHTRQQPFGGQTRTLVAPAL